ncbi:MAG: THUMP domain-containing protein [Spirochaetales bacterium]
MDMNPEKRIRRHILSKSYRFLAVVQPAFRDTTMKELAEKGFSIVGAVESGVEFEGRMEEGWRANLLLRTVSRVYCRIESFRAGAREELYRKALGIPWELWIDPHIPLRVESSARGSRVHHEGVLRDTIREAIHHRWKESGTDIPRQGRSIGENMEEPENLGGPEEHLVQRVLVHSEGSRCTLSLDMSGEGLYRRGYRTIPGEAPIREDLAASLLLELGWRGEGILCDPMTGSGTFAIEGSLMAEGIPAGWNRRFQFQNWPSFRENRWNYIRKQAISALSWDTGTGQSMETYHPSKSPSGGKEGLYGCFASDVDARAVQTARRNSTDAGVEECIHLEEKDFFTIDGEFVESRIREFRKSKVHSRSRFLVLNPPYGKRLGIDGEYFRRLWTHIHTAFPHWKILLLLPASVDLTGMPGSKRARRLLFRHGGLRIQALFLQRGPLP